MDFLFEPSNLPSLLPILGNWQGNLLEPMADLSPLQHLSAMRLNIGGLNMSDFSKSMADEYSP
jgi:hypothetical protein